MKIHCFLNHNDIPVLLSETADNKHNQESNQGESSHWGEKKVLAGARLKVGEVAPTSNDWTDQLPVDLSAGLFQTWLRLLLAAAHLPYFTNYQFSFSVSKIFLQLYDGHRSGCRETEFAHRASSRFWKRCLASTCNTQAPQCLLTRRVNDDPTKNAKAKITVHNHLEL